jgi:signal transduction histidine kinase
MISLFDKSQQHIIAEATRTLSLQSDDIHEPDDEIWLGVCTLPKTGGICQLVVDLPSQYAQNDPDGIRTDVYIIPDLSKDDRFLDKSFVTSKPFARFYAGVPIRSPKGYYIGSYCILDDHPREGVSGHALQFMKDMARTVMEHLELTRTREEHRRGERMVRGLGSFHEGKETLRVWRPGYNLLGDIGVDGYQRLSIDEVQDDEEARYRRIHSHGDHADTSTEGSPETSFSSKHAFITPKPSHFPQSVPPMLMSHAKNVVDPGSGMSYMSGSEEQVRPKVHTLQDDILSSGVRSAFSRAANIIRESIEVDGAVFFDASISSYRGLVHDVNSTHSSDTNLSALGSRDEDLDGGSIKHESFEELSSGPEQNIAAAGILGFSHVASIGGDPAPMEQEAMSEELLKGLAKRFPNGRIFDFGEDGLIASGSSSEDDFRRILIDGEEDTHISSARRKSKIYSKTKEANAINKVFPGVRCAALVPLWDNNRQRCFSLGFVWTTSPKRLLTLEGELSYLAVFGNTIMAEVARLDALTADKAKSDLLGSISHELRSPLHGILGSVELLEDLVVNPNQYDLVHSIETCGRTLLETINHLLDYSKINHSYELYREIRRNERKRRIGKVTQHSHIQSADTVDIGAIAEEVMSVATGSHGNFATATEVPGPIGSLPTLPPLSNVDLSLDVPGKLNWNFRTQGGAWRRMIMNLFSNSLKYMDKEDGFVKVTLGQEVLPKKHAGQRCKVILNVTDTGKGMGEDYLQSRLFTPFAQEDQLAPGTGLGLSIVRQIVSSLGGKIEVNSLKGIGTDIRVSVIMAQGPDQKPEIGDLYSIPLVAAKTRNLSVGILGFEAMSKSESLPKAERGARKPGEASLRLHGLNGLQHALENMCKDWFGMQVHSGTNLQAVQDLFIIAENERNSEEIRRGLLFELLQTRNDGRVLRIVVLCKTAYSAGILKSAIQDDAANRVVEFISQPCGPRKLAKALWRCLYQGLHPREHPVQPSMEHHHENHDDKRPLAVNLPIDAIQTRAEGNPSQPRADLSSQIDSEVQRGFGKFLLVDDNHINLQVSSTSASRGLIVLRFTNFVGIVYVYEKEQTRIHNSREWSRSIRSIQEHHSAVLRGIYG